MQSADLARLQPPGRDVPSSVRLFVRLARIEGLMFFLSLTALLSAAVVPNTDWRWFLFLGAVDGAFGQVVNAEERGFQEGNQTVSRVYFEFERGGRKETGNSHYVGSRPRIGDQVRIEWPRDHPGVTRIEGEFQRGDAIRIVGPEGEEIGRGLVAFDAADAERIRGRNSAEIEAILGYAGRPEMVHRDDMALRGECPESRSLIFTAGR